MTIQYRLRQAARFTRLDADKELLTEAADALDRLSASAALPTLRPGDSHMESLIEAAIQGHASTRDAMRWLVRQVIKPDQQPATPKPVGFMYQAEIEYADSTGGNGSFWRVPPDLDDESVPLYTHPAPSVPDDVVRDAISTVREHYRGTDWGKAAESICDAIDAAMLAAK